MCAARVEVVAENAVVRSGEKELGRGQKTYDLRDFDPRKDISIYSGKELDPEIDGVSHLRVDFGKGMGEVAVGTREHDTTVSAKVYPPGSEKGILVPGDSIILDESYGWGKPSPVVVSRHSGDDLVIVTHKSR